MGRPAGLRLRVRGSDRRGVGAARGALGPHRGDGFAAVRARPRRLRVAATHAGGSRLARGGQIEELPARAAEYGHAALAHLERHLFADEPPAGRPSTARSASSKAAGARGSLELVAEEIRELAAAGRRSRRSPSSSRRIERWRASARDRARNARNPVRDRGACPARPDRRSGRRCSRCSASSGSTAAAATSTRSSARRSPASRARTSTFSRAGCAGGRLVARDGRGGDDQAARRAAAAAARGAAQRRRAGRGRPRGRRGDAARRARAGGAARRRGEPRRPARIRRGRCDCSTSSTAGGARRRARRPTRCWRRSSTPRSGSARRGERGRVAVLDLARARTRRFEAVFLLGLEEGTLPRRGNPSPFLDDDARGELDRDARARLVRPDPVERERYLFYTACTRATRRLTLVREAATDEGSPREPSPFWDEVAVLFDPDDVRRWTRRRPLSQLTWELEEAPTERERLRALALLAVDRAATRRAGACRRERLGAPARARAARLHARDEAAHPRVLAELSAQDAVQRHRARALRRLLVGLVLRAPDLRRDRSTGESTRCCAARSRTRPCTASTPACHARSAATGSKRAASTRRWRSSASASTARSAASGWR